MISRRKLFTLGTAGLAGAAVLGATRAQAQAAPQQYFITQWYDLIPRASVAPILVNNLDPAAPGYQPTVHAQWYWVTIGSTASTGRMHLHTSPEIVHARLHVIAHAWHVAYGLGAKLVIQDRSAQFYHDIGSPLWLQPSWAQNAEDFTADMEAERQFQVADEAATDPATDPQQGLGNPIGVQFFGVGRLVQCRLTVKYKLVVGGG